MSQTTRMQFNTEPVVNTLNNSNNTDDRVVNSIYLKITFPLKSEIQILMVGLSNLFRITSVNDVTCKLPTESYVK